MLFFEVSRALAVRDSMQQAGQAWVSRNITLTVASQTEAPAPPLGPVEIDGTGLRNSRRPKPESLHVRLRLVSALETLLYQESSDRREILRYQDVKIALARPLSGFEASWPPQKDSVWSQLLYPVPEKAVAIAVGLRCWALAWSRTLHHHDLICPVPWTAAGLCIDSTTSLLPAVVAIAPEIGATLPYFSPASRACAAGWLLLTNRQALTRVREKGSKTFGQMSSSRRLDLTRGLNTSPSTAPNESGRFQRCCISKSGQ